MLACRLSSPCTAVFLHLPALTAWETDFSTTFLLYYPDLNPTWRKIKDFYYETKYADQLSNKVVSFTCMRHQTIGESIELGVVNIDLLSIAAGPTLHDFPLMVKHHRQKPGEPAKFVPSGGRLRVEIEMHQLSNMTVVLDELTINSFRVPKAMRLQFKYGRELENQKAYHKSAKPTDVRADELRWPGMNIAFYTSLIDLENEFFHVMTVDGSTGSKCPHLDRMNIKVPFKHILKQSGIESRPVFFKESISDTTIPNAESKTFFSCKLTLIELPRFCQLIGGIHTEEGLTGTSRYTGFIMPKRYTSPEDASSPPTKHIPRGGSPPPVIADAEAPKKGEKLVAGTEMPAKKKKEDAKDQKKVEKKSSKDIKEGKDGREADAVEKRVSSGVSSPAPVAAVAQSPYGAGGNIAMQAPPAQNGASPANARRASQPAQGLTPQQLATLPLPAGWESNVDGKGRIFYIDNNTKTTTWVHPMAKQAQANLQQQNQPPQQPQQQALNGYAPSNYYPPQQQQQAMSPPPQIQSPLMQQAPQMQQPQMQQPPQQQGYQQFYQAPPPQQPSNYYYAAPYNPNNPFSTPPTQHIAQAPNGASAAPQPVQRVAASSPAASPSASPKPSKSKRPDNAVKVQDKKGALYDVGTGIAGKSAKTTVDSPKDRKKK